MEGVTFRLGDRLALPWEEPRLDEEGERISRDNWQAVNVLPQIWISLPFVLCTLWLLWRTRYWRYWVLARRARDEKTAEVAPRLLVCGKVTGWPATEEYHLLNTYILLCSCTEVAERLQGTT